MDSIPGLGELTIATVLAEVPNILAFKTAAQLSAFAGVTPCQFRSGARTPPAYELPFTSRP